MLSVMLDEDLIRRMSELIVAVNRRRHAETHVATLSDPTHLRLLVAEEERAEQAYVRALETRGWRSPFAAARASA